jgi:hypothetical protein
MPWPDPHSHICCTARLRTHASPIAGSAEYGASHYVSLQRSAQAQVCTAIAIVTEVSTENVVLYLARPAIEICATRASHLSQSSLTSFLYRSTSRPCDNSSSVAKILLPYTIERHRTTGGHLNGTSVVFTVHVRR